MTKVSINDLELILSGAKAIQDAENFRKELEAVDFSDSDNRQGIYGIAEQYNISRESVDKYLALRFPSEERQLETLTNLNAKPTGEVIIQTYETNLLNKLRENLPLCIFKTKVKKNSSGELKSCKFYELKKEGESIFGTKVKKVELARIVRPRFDNLLIINESFFSEICSEEIIRLQKRFKGCPGNISSIRYEYNPHLSD